MNVSRIEGFNPAIKINWQTLTAREILRFSDLGVQVPNEFLTWASEFIESVYEGDKDSVTYEMAQSFQVRKSEENNNSEVNSVQPSAKLNEEEISQNPVETEIPFTQVENTEESVIEDENYLSQTSNAINNTDVVFNQNVQHDVQISELEQQMRIILSNAGVLNNNTQNEFSKNFENNSFSQRIIELRNQIEQFKNSNQIDFQSEFERLNFELDSQLFSLLNFDNNGLLDFNKKEDTEFGNMNNDKNNDLENQSLERNPFEVENRQQENNVIKNENFENENVLNEYKVEDDSPEAKLSDPNKASLDEILKRKIRRGIEL